MAKLLKKYNKNFTVLTNDLFKDKRLSYKDLGLLVQLLSLPDNWEFNVKGIAKLHKDGEDSVKSGLVKLEEYGYLTRVQSRDEKGHLSSSDYYIYDDPKDNVEYNAINKGFTPQVENPPMDGNSPSGENPLADNPTVENPVNKEYIDKESINNVVMNDQVKYDFEIRENAIKYFEDSLKSSDKYKVYNEINDTNTFINAMNKLIDLVKEQNLTKLEKCLKLSQKEIVRLLEYTIDVKEDLYKSYDNPDGYIVSRLNKALEKV